MKLALRAARAPLIGTEPCSACGVRALARASHQHGNGKTPKPCSLWCTSAATADWVVRRGGRGLPSRVATLSSNVLPTTLRWCARSALGRHSMANSSRSVIHRPASYKSAFLISNLEPLRRRSQREIPNIMGETSPRCTASLNPSIPFERGKDYAPLCT